MEQDQIDESISVFTSLFESLKFSDPANASAYYVLSVTAFSDTLKNFTKTSKYPYSKLIKGRSELLKRGYIAKIIDVDENIKGLNFKKGELYIPVNPKFIYEDLKHIEYAYFADEEIANRRKVIQLLTNDYKDNLGEFGVKTTERSISIYYKGLWFFYTLINNLNTDHRLKLMMGRLGSFKTPYLLAFFEKAIQMHQENIYLQIIYNFSLKTNKELLEERLNNLNQLKIRYPNNLDYVPSPVPHATSRRIIFEASSKPYMVIDARKIFPQSEMKVPEDPSYIGTIYFQPNALDTLNEYFDEAWNEIKRGKKPDTKN